jgi:NAD(P)-dependent dehydrogenase (short-subunit alcohol dehydrogenase family)
MKTVIVTGAAGNLGKAVVEKFIAEGWRVVGTVSKNKFQHNYPDKQFETFTADLTDEAASNEFIQSTVSRQGNIDAAVLTVGGFAMGNIENTPVNDIQQQLQLNFETAYNIARPVFEQMINQKSGRIFLIGSKAGLGSADGKGMVAYSLAKSLLFRLAELMNDEAKGTDVFTTVVVPGTIDTPQNRQAMPNADFDKWVKPATIANAVFFHTTAEAAAIKEPVLKVYNNA